MLKSKKYPAKLLLFGEHLILDGADGLAIPFDRYGGKWTKGQGSDPLKCFFQHLLDLPFIHLKNLEEIINGKIHFKSDIPRGYGLGSSGALCAAIYEKAVPEFYKKEGGTILTELAEIEGFFHGKSSGMDAYVALYNNPILFKDRKTEVINLDLSKLPFSIFLLDSGIPRESKSLINRFTKKNDDHMVIKELVKTSDLLVGYLMSQSFAHFQNKMKALSQYQYDLLDYMIVATIKPIWKNSLTADDYSIKLCGAGGGGFYLAFGNPDAIQNLGISSVRVI
ncbi:MAG: hypothetical protein V3V00_03660 [Saprospiraceae bacterium]